MPEELGSCSIVTKTKCGREELLLCSLCPGLGIWQFGLQEAGRACKQTWAPVEQSQQKNSHRALRSCSPPHRPAALSFTGATWKRVQQLLSHTPIIVCLWKVMMWEQNLRTVKDFWGHARNHVCVFLEVSNLLGFCLTPYAGSLDSFIFNRFIVIKECGFSLDYLCSGDGQQCHSMQKLHILLELLFKIHYFICKM